MFTTIKGMQVGEQRKVNSLLTIERGDNNYYLAMFEDKENGYFNERMYKSI